MDTEEEGEIKETMEVDEEDNNVIIIAPSTPLPPPKPKLNKPSPYEILRQSKTSVQEIVSKMLAVKKESKSKTELSELVTQMFLNLVSLRQANRTILLEEDKVKAETERAKTPVDFTTLQLHNLMYEKSHYVKAIKACKDFKSKYPDIELVPEEEFFRDASVEIKGGITSNDSAHNVMLKRLNYELFQRKELCKRHEKLKQSKKKLLETIANRKKFLSSLPSHLKSLKKASLPLQNQLGIHHTKKLKQQHSAELLPPPLYVIYSQLMAHKEAFGENIDLEIVGSVKDAQTYARQQANKDSGNSTNTDSSRMEEEALDDEDDGQRRRKRPKKIQNKDSVDQAGIYQVHPLKIVLHINDDVFSDPKSSKLLSLKFEYLTKLNVACVGIEGSHERPENNIMCNLFPNDTGLELPLQSAKLLVGDAFLFSEKRPLRPYKWVQHLSGIDFLPEMCPLLSESEAPSSESTKTSAVRSGLALYRQQNRVETIVQRIRSRKKAQLALQEQLDLLRKLKWPKLTCETVPWALHSSLCNLQDWSQVGSQLHQVSTLLSNDTPQFQGPSDIDMNERHENTKEEVESAREDGELPSLVSVSSVSNSVKLTSEKESDIDHSRELALISKSAVTPMYKLKSQSFKKVDDDLDLMLDSDSDMGEPPEHEDETSSRIKGFEIDKTWMDYGVREFGLVLSRKVDTRGIHYKLEAKIKISMEYPLRPPLFALSLSHGENGSQGAASDWYNELRAMEAEVNLHIIKMINSDQENYVLAHQVLCLAMLFDLYMDEAFPSSEKEKAFSSQILARSCRGRDRKKMISWKDFEQPSYI